MRTTMKDWLAMRNASWIALKLVSVYAFVFMLMLWLLTFNLEGPAEQRHIAIAAFIAIAVSTWPAAKIIHEG